MFSSEIKGLFAYPEMKVRVDKEGLCEVFGLGPAKTYGKGVFQNVSEVLPGHFLEFDRNGLRDYCYWQLESKAHDESYEETVEARDLPCMADVESSMLYFCRKVAKNNKVTLTGDFLSESQVVHADTA